jgi:hypothetical protein
MSREDEFRATFGLVGLAVGLVGGTCLRAGMGGPHQNYSSGANRCPKGEKSMSAEREKVRMVVCQVVVYVP